MVGRVSYLGRGKLGNYHSNVSYTRPNPNYTLSKPNPFIITYPIHHPTLGTQTGRVLPFASINTTLPWIPTYPHPSILIPYQSNYPTLPTVGKVPLPTLRIYPYLPHPRQFSLHYCTHLTLPFITYPNLHFPTLYYWQGLITYKVETAYQIRPKRHRPKRLSAEVSQTKMTRECSCGCRTSRIVHLII